MHLDQNISILYIQISHQAGQMRCSMGDKDGPSFHPRERNTIEAENYVCRNTGKELTTC